MSFKCRVCECQTMVRTIKYKWAEKLLQNICLECLNKEKQSIQKKRFLKDLDNREFDFHWTSWN